MDAANLKSTPLKDEHVRLGAKMVDFAGWYMPVQYQGVKEEHLATRTGVGLFDVSHMGEIWVRGPKSLATLEWLTTNDASKLKKNQAQYSLYPNEKGGIVDDLFVYCIEPGHEYLLCVNASNADKDFAFMQANNKGAELTNESSKWAQIAVQGPKAMDLLSDALGREVLEIPRNEFRAMKDMLVARTGYTGEDGCEIFVPVAKAVTLWRELVEKGGTPIGLGARDTLRTEMKYSLYGNEIDDDSNPFAAGLGWVVKPAAKDFLGKAAMLAKKASASDKLVGFKMLERGIPRHGYGVLAKGSNEKIGFVTSGTFSPSLNESIGIAYVKASLAEPGSEFCIDIRGKGVLAQTVATPFVTNTSLKK